METLQAAGMSVYRTDTTGELTLRFTDDGAVAVGSIT
jgi:beta-lactamase superfamily II metal-dependent hydrolase